MNILNTLMILCPYFLSFATGALLLSLLFRGHRPFDTWIHLFLSGGIGLGLHALILFWGYIAFGRLRPGLILGSSFILFIFLIGLKLYLDWKQNRLRLSLSFLKLSDLLFLAALILMIIPLWIEARYYPLGGWDAWSAWNLKARFLFLGQERWDNLFDPILWRSSPHYPLLLPLINVWGWMFMRNPNPVIPLVTSIVFTVMTIGLLSAILKQWIPRGIAVGAGLLIFTLPFFVQNATSQYCDIVLSYYLLASLYCLLMTRIHGHHSFAFLSGLFLGLLSFTKSEGAMAALILFLLAWPYLLNVIRSQKNSYTLPFFLLLGGFLSFTANFYFEILYSPGNQTFINGIFSESRPVTQYRGLMILAFLIVEWCSQKWNGIWILLTIGALLGIKNGFRGGLWLLPVFLGVYLAVLITYYLINTYFEIGWWLRVTLNRLLLAILPIAVLWVSLALWGDASTNREKINQGL